MDDEHAGTELRALSAVSCAQCGCLSSLRWAGWRAYRVDEPELREPPTLAFYCPECAAAEFGARGPRP